MVDFDWRIESPEELNMKIKWKKELERWVWAIHGQVIIISKEKYICKQTILMVYLVLWFKQCNNFDNQLTSRVGKLKKYLSLLCNYLKTKTISFQHFGNRTNYK